MSRPVSRAEIIGAIIRKDLVEFSRDRLWMILTPLALVMFAVVFWLLPATVDEAITVGIYPRELAEALTREPAEPGSQASDDGIRVAAFETEAELIAAVQGERKAVVAGEEYTVSIGLAFPPDVLARVRAGNLQGSVVQVYVNAAVPPEIRDAMTSAVREITYAMLGVEVPVTQLPQQEMILGVDRSGAQVPLRERMRPMLAFFVLITESLALASLIASEVGGARTVTALLVTPARVTDILAAKAILGTALAFGQAVILLLVTQSFGANAPVLLAAVLLGALLVAGVGMLTGAAGRDFMGTLFYGVLFLLPLIIPAMAILFPGTASTWVQVLPSYGIIQAMLGATAYNQGFADLAGYFGMAAAWVIAVFTLGWLVLSRKVATL